MTIQIAIVALLVLLSVGLLGRKLWSGLKRRRAAAKECGCGKCSGCG